MCQHLSSCSAPVTKRTCPYRNGILDILIMSPMSATRFWLIVGSFVWSALLLWPGYLFTDARTTYYLMRMVAPEHIWGCVFFIQAVWALYTLKCQVRSKASLLFDAFLGCLLWTSTTLLCFASHWPHGYDGFIDQLIHYPPPAAMSGEVALTLASWWHFVRHWAEKENV